MGCCCGASGTGGFAGGGVDAADLVVEGEGRGREVYPRRCYAGQDGGICDNRTCSPAIAIHGCTVKGGGSVGGHGWSCPAKSPTMSVTAGALYEFAIQYLGSGASGESSGRGGNVESAAARAADFAQGQHIGSSGVYRCRQGHGYICCPGAVATRARGAALAGVSGDSAGIGAGGGGEECDNKGEEAEVKN